MALTAHRIDWEGERIEGGKDKKKQAAARLVLDEPNAVEVTGRGRHCRVRRRL